MPDFLTGSTTARSESQPVFGRTLRQTKSEAKTRQFVVHWWGDSISVGDDASSYVGQAGLAGNTHALKQVWRDAGCPGVLAGRLQAELGDGGSGFCPIGLGVTTGTWTAGHGFGACESRASAAASMEWRVRGDTVKIWHRNANLTGSFRYQIDGGGFTTVTPPTGFGVDPGVVTVAGLHGGEHLVRCEWVSGTIGLSGVSGIRGTTGARVDRIAQHGLAANHLGRGTVGSRSVRVGTTSGQTALTAAIVTFTSADIGSFIFGPNVGATGMTITDVASATSATLSGNATATSTLDHRIVQPLYPATSEAGAALDRNAIGALTINPAFSEGLGLPDVVVFALSVNDPSTLAHTPENLIENFSRIIGTYSGMGATVNRTPEFVFIVQHLGKWFDVASAYTRYVRAVYDVSETVGGAVLDMWALGRRSWQFMTEQGYWSGATSQNQVHLSRDGQALIGNMVADLII